MEDRAYMTNPLVVWVETFRNNESPPLLYKDLYNGVFLCDVMQQIDPRPAYQNVVRAVEDDVSLRLQNWDLLVKNIRAYYVEVLQQLLIVKLPNIHAICQDPHKDTSFEEIRKVLLLVLGCAVQCEQKQNFIENITQLDLEVQHAIVEHIKEITDDSESILPIEAPAELEPYTEKMFAHLTRLIKERDDFSETIRDLMQERDYYQSQAEGAPTPITPSVTPEKHHLAVELAESKAKLRRTRQELEEKQEQLSDVKDELEENKGTLARLRSENLDLIQDARATRALRDELDIVKEKASKVDTYEKEIAKYKEKLNELEFYKARMEELREENNILEETKSVLEDQLASSHKRVETVRELENELLQFRERIQAMTEERDSDREKIQQLTEEILRLELDKKNSMNESANLEQELQDARHKSGLVGGSLSDQLSETSHAKILRLQLENQQLQQKLQEAEENAMIQNTAVNLENEKEIQRLSKKLEKVQENNSSLSQNLIDIEATKEELSRERDKLIQTMEMVKENSDRQVRELEVENEHLAQTVEVLRERNEKSNDARLKDLERENRRLHETVTTKNAHLSKLEFENKQLSRSCQKLNENEERLAELEAENAKLEKENSEMHKHITTIELTCDKLGTVELENTELEVETRRLSKTVETLQNSLKKKEQLEEQNINLTVENQKLQRALDSFKDSTEKNLQLENDKDSLNREIQQLKKHVESQKAHKAKLEQMEFEILDLDNENQRIQKTLDITTKRMEQLEIDNSDLENENEKLAKTLESMKVSMKRLEEKEKEALEMETELGELQKERNSLEKENRKLKHTLDQRESSHDELSGKFASLEQDYKGMKKSMDRMKDAYTRVKELEKENKELLQEAQLEKKTIATLREDLVNEKIKSTKLGNDLETLRHELERVGINREKLAVAESAEGDSRYKALESMMEDAFQKSLSLKEQKIQLLESRLEESKSWNQKLNKQLQAAQRESATLKQRHEEEENIRGDGDGKHRTELRVQWEHNPTQDILALKDHLVQLERDNATLLSENSNMKMQTSTLHEQVHKIEDQNNNLLSKNSTLQEQFVSLQSQNAKLQVENTTLQSKCTSLFSHNNALQSQISTLESEHELLIQNHEDLQSSHESFVCDHEALQQLHEQLTTDYESLISEHGSLKSIHKSLKTELRDLQEQLDSLLQGKDDVNKLRDLLEREREQLKSELRALGNLQMDYDRLRDEHDRLRSGYDKLNQEYRTILNDHKQLKSNNNTLNLKNTELVGEMGECKDTITNMDIEIQKQENRFDALYQVNQKLDEENRALLYQVQQLLNQNQDLLTQALNSKDQHQEEQMSYMEKLAELRRQKERLEEKIMEHYKNRWDSPKKNKGFGAMIARKARGIISRRQRSKSRPSLVSESPDDSTTTGTSQADTTDQVNDSRKSDKRARRCSEGSALLASPKLAKQNKSLAKSTTALNFMQSPLDRSKLRGAKSSEDITNDSSHNASGEKDSLSSGNSTQPLPGLGRPYNATEDQEAGFMPLSPKSPLTRRAGSPGSEMLTLEQFLTEANKSSPPVSLIQESSKKKSMDRRSQDDAESRSTGSAGSDPAYRGVVLRKPSSVSQHQDMSQRYSSHIPDVAASAQSHPDLNMSGLSRISGGSGNIPEASPPPSNRPDLKTSTPKPNNDLYGPRPYGNERQKPYDNTKWQDSQKVAQRLPIEDMRSPPYHRPDDYRGSQTADSQFNNSTRSYQYNQPPSQMSPEPVRSPPPLPNNRMPSSQSRELPPTPSDRLAATERLDRLTMMSSVSSTASDQHVSGHYSSRQSLPSDGRGYDRDMTLGHQSREPRPQPQGGIRGQSPAPPRNYRSHSPGGNHYATPGRPNIPSSSSSGSLERGQGDRPHTYGRPTGAAAQFQHKQYNNVSSRPSSSRPASVMGQPSYQSNSQGSSRNEPIYSSVERVRHSNGSRPTVLEGSTGSKSQSTAPQTNGPYSVSQSSYAQRTHPVERPKSVPPHMFNPNNDYQPSQRRGNVPPVPPPRKMREPGPQGGAVSLVREPTSSRDRPSTDGSNVPGPQQPVSNQMSAAARLLSNTRPPTARIQPQTKAPQNRSSQPVRPVKADEPPQTQQQQTRQGQGQAPNKNSVWYEYGCV